MTDESVRRGRGRPRDPRVEGAILDAAMELFLERGAETASIEQIAKRAGVAKLTLYRRWSSKEELLAQAIEEMRLGLPDQSLWTDADMPLPELLKRVLDAAAEFLTYPGVRTLLSRLIGTRTDHPSLMEVYWKHYVLPRREIVRAVLDRAAEEGLLRPGTDPDVLMDTVVGAVLVRLLMRPDQPTAPEVRAYLVGVLRQAGVMGLTDEEP